MPSVQVTLVASTVSSVTLDAPTDHIVVTQEAGTPAVVYATADGSTPVIPTNDVEVTGSQQEIPAVLGAQAVLDPPQYGDHMVIPTVRLLSAGAPTVEIAW